ncbi:DUF1194 domain-containing protein [Primorskyibacter flagellatus]|uniref:VPLPA-CTERM protein sorting domain-containing protein n=1 Tax=Primorskyibacter flagellatus TaxID=1387277 RepID=A0A1W2E5I5_9RHOB|nr:DUF1194 domain-containing protein [Primorskyibacter flagellatus]SMD04672.1 VPLPA-CTERM protein sorting domain-containing protein [Primorskyibacter flagellatus]
MIAKNLRTAVSAVVIGLSSVASANAATVDTLLSLVIDVSGSIDSTEYNLQSQGYIDAFNDVAIRNAIFDTSNGEQGAIAVNVIQFGSNAHQSIGFSLIEDAASADAFVAALNSMGRAESGSTNVAAGVNLATSSITSWLGTAGNSTGRVVVDVSGDGAQNTSCGGNCDATLQSARDTAIGAGVDTINAIAIQSAGLQSYFDTNIVAGSNSFSLFASDFDTFGTSIRTKLLSEIDGTVPAVPLPMPAFLLLAGFGGLGLMRRRRKNC